uniref:C2H2-type domain-containing protein n=1 Tax=Leptobrachium leishanense TaxID=445787 RepID=A0A8C5PC32_9ANUR
MDKEKNLLSQKILDLTLDIIYLLTGEDHIVVKKPGGRNADRSIHQVCDRYSEIRSVVPSPPLLMHERNNKGKILELSNQIIRLLTGEVPIRCEDVTVYLSMEEWEYVERHKDLYEDVMMEDHQPVISLDAGRCPVSRPNTEIKNKTESIKNKGEKYPKTNEPGQAEAATRSSHTFLSSGNGILLDPGIYPTTEHSQRGYPPTDIKEDPASCDEGNLISQADRPFKCTECGKGLSTKYSLRQHYMIHTGEKPFKCSKCWKSYTHKSELVHHERTHTGEKPFQCFECGKCFAQASQLVRHNVIHSGEKPFQCKECGECFSLKTSLRDHQRTHTGEKPFRCSECGNRFTRSSNLIAHKIIHTGEKPFKCHECGKCFSHASHLSSHKKIHTGEKPFKCPECGRCFIRASTLTVHKMIHTGEKPFKCNHCGKGFNRRNFEYFYISN